MIIADAAISRLFERKIFDIFARIEVAFSSPLKASILEATIYGNEKTEIETPLRSSFLRLFLTPSSYQRFENDVGIVHFPPKMRE